MPILPFRTIERESTHGSGTVDSRGASAVCGAKGASLGADDVDHGGDIGDDWDAADGGALIAAILIGAVLARILGWL